MFIGVDTMNKVIIITGGSDGLGKAIAKTLSKDNKIIILSTNENKLKAVSEELDCDYRVCDVTKTEEIEETIKSFNKLSKELKNLKGDCMNNKNKESENKKDNKDEK